MVTPEPAAPTVSVVIPVHNAGALLRPCLNSVLGQSLRELEVIVVDDASSDGSATVLATVAAEDPRVRVVTLPANCGASAARNVGLAAATGEFVAFVDADDLLEAGMYTSLVQAAAKLQCDVVSCGIQVVNPEGRLIETTPFPLVSGVRHDHQAVREALHGAWRSRLLWYPVRSVYRRSLLGRHSLGFVEGIHKGEDSVFNLEALWHADGVAAIDDAPYLYRKHSQSATARPLGDESGNIDLLGERVTGFYRDHGFEARAYEDFYGQVLRSDLPTALLRLRGNPSLASQARALVTSKIVRTAFKHRSIAGLRVPARVAALLVLCRLRAVPLIVTLLRSGRAGREPAARV